MPTPQKTDSNSLDLVTTEEAAQLLKLAPGTLCNMRVQRLGPPFVRLGRAVRYRVQNLLEYLENNTHGQL